MYIACCQHTHTQCRQQYLYQYHAQYAAHSLTYLQLQHVHKSSSNLHSIQSINLAANMLDALT